MKTVTLLTALCGLVLLSCRSETAQILSDISGRWQVQSIAYTAAGRPDSLAVLNGATFDFESCKKAKNQTTPTTCTMTLTNNGQTQAMGFQADENNTLSMTPKNSSATTPKLAYDLGGNYNVEVLNDRNMVLRQTVNTSDPGLRLVVTATR